MDDWKKDHDAIYNAAPKRQLGRVATLCVGGCKNGQYVDAGVGTQFYRALRPSKQATVTATPDSGYVPERRVDCYRLVHQANGVNLFVLEK